MNPNTKRCLECPARTTSGTCQITDRGAGWLIGMPLDVCDACFKAGGIKSDGVVRHKWLAASIDSLKSKLADCPRSVIFAILNWHCTLDEAQGFLDREEVMDAATREVRWSLARESWEQAEHFQRGSLKDFLKSLWSRAFEEPVTLAVFMQRQMSCFGEKGSTPCPSLRTASDGIHHWCGDCGCGDKKRAWLDDPQGKGGYTKLHYPYLVCPRSKPGFSTVSVTKDGQPLP